MENEKASRLPYQPGIDGLRAIAVLAVLFYHAEMTWMPGGFLGVEVFFVISGYLITGLLLSEWNKTGSINLGRFWFRRARRLLPAVFTLLFVVVVFALLFLPNEVANLRPDVLAAAAYISNWYQVFSQRSYFEAIGRPPLLRHLWSLAVEEQFYLVWPLLLVAGVRLLQPRGKYLLPIGTAVLAVSSTLLMASLYQPDLDPSRAYYGTDTRAAGFLMGAVLAMFLPAGRIPDAGSARKTIALEMLGSAALIALLVTFVKVDEINPYLYLGGFTLVSFLSALVIVATVYPGTRILAALLSRRLLVWIGLRSYSIYLWHWPIFDLTRPHVDTNLDGLSLFIVRFALTAIAAELSYRFIERPIREGALGRVWRKIGAIRKSWAIIPYALTGSVLAVVCVMIGMSVARATPPEIPAEYRDDAIATTADPTATPQYDGVQHTSSGSDTANLLATEVPVATSSVPFVSSTITTVPEALTVPRVTTSISGTPTVTPTPVPTPSAVSAVLTVTVTTSQAHVVAGTVLTSTDINQTGTPVSHTKTVTDVLGGYFSILAVGDSVMRGAATELLNAFGNAEIDAVVSRQAGAVITLLQARRTAGTLPDVVIIHVGNNAYVTPKQFDDMLQILDSVPVVVVVNVRVPRRWEGPNNALFDEGVKRTYNALLVDWYSASDSLPELFTEDGVHLQPGGQRLYASLIIAKLKGAHLIHRDKSPGLNQAQ